MTSTPSRTFDNPEAAPPGFSILDRRFMHRRWTPLALAAALALAASPAGLASTGKAPAPASASASAASAAKPMPLPKKVDINSASAKELKALPGIGDAEARRIIAARPYPSKAKLVADNVISYEAFLVIKDQIVAVQKVPPKSKASAPPAAKTTEKPGGKS